MTRETKIGLLVGLAFIIVIGILLSDHLTSTTEPPQAKLTQAGSNVRQGVSVPGAATANPPVTTVVAPAPVTPQQPIPTKGDLTPRPQPVQIVQIGPSAQASAQQQTSQAPVTVAPAQTPAQMIAQPAPNQEAQQQVVDSTPVGQSPSDSLAQVAKQIGEEIVGLTEQPPAAPPPAANGAPALSGGKAYKAQEGDTLSKLAGRFLGGNTKANRDTIIRANPSLAKNPDIVVVGKTYIIPTAGAGGAQSAQVNPGLQSGGIQQTPSATPEYWYTVKENDSLRKIAFNQLGNEDAWAAIQDLNRSTLKGEDKTVVVPGMKLKLPAKPIAAAN